MDAEVAQGLAALKREGGSVLLVGMGSDAQGDVCGRFLAGDDDRVFVDTDSTVRNDEETAETVIERPFSTRNSAAGSAQPGASTEVRPLVSDLETAMRETATGDTLRVCFDSVRPFVDATDVPTLVSSLESVREAARDAGAVVHLHLPAMPEAVPAPLFDAVDAVVEVRRQSGTTHQRWRFPGETETTEWVEV